MGPAAVAVVEVVEVVALVVGAAAVATRAAAEVAVHEVAVVAQVAVGADDNAVWPCPRQCGIAVTMEHCNPRSRTRTPAAQRSRCCRGGSLGFATAGELLSYGLLV